MATTTQLKRHAVDRSALSTYKWSLPDQPRHELVAQIAHWDSLGKLKPTVAMLRRLALRELVARELEGRYDGTEAAQPWETDGEAWKER